MTAMPDNASDRKRAPSQRALATRARVLDAAEKIFADRGFDGATIRDVAAEAGERIGTVHHHGGGKEALFRQVVARRADVLAAARLDALTRARAAGRLDLHAVLSAFIRPAFDLAKRDLGWQRYARLVAFVSTDARWKPISADYFDPTVARFMEELRALRPEAPAHELSGAFVYSVSAMLALMTSRGRIDDLGADDATPDAQVEHLVRYCAAGFAA